MVMYKAGVETHGSVDVNIREQAAKENTPIFVECDGKNYETSILKISTLREILIG
jgi:hypothetical protein